MRVAVDARHLGRGRGVARYLESMLAALAAGHPEAEWVAVVSPGQECLLPAGVQAARSATPARLANASAAVTGRPRIDRVAGGADVVWIPAPAPVAWSSGVPAVLTIHDISWEQRPSDFTAYERAWHAAARPRRLARRARRIACVSETTREALLTAGWPVGPDKAEVVPEAPAVVPSGAPPPGNGRYLLYVGALEPRKGIETLAEAMGVARGHGLSLPLVVVGQGRLAGLLSGIAGVEMKGQATEPELAELYAGATALVLPSLLEGFGLPPVEAAACGVPTVASDLPVLREFLGDGFLAVPPGDPVRLGDALFRVSTDGALRSRLGRAAQETVAGLSWETSADRLFAILCEAAGSPSP
jgi:glycosyltransferase involved in cell wall biosynthesis